MISLDALEALARKAPVMREWTGVIYQCGYPFLEETGVHGEFTTAVAEHNKLVQWVRAACDP
jgi:hypothetical protein